MKSTDELFSDPHFPDALRTFYWLQEWGSRHRNDTKRENLQIREVLADHYGWMHLAGDPVKNKKILDQTHQSIGYLIAHSFPLFAALCTKPVYVVFDHADNRNNGIYHLAYYAEAKDRIMEELVMELAKVSVFQNTVTGQQYTRIRVYEPFLCIGERIIL